MKLSEVVNGALMKKRNLTNPVWTIERHRGVWLAAAAAHDAAFDFYRDSIYAVRPDYSWGHSVAGYHQEAVHQIREAFDAQHARGEVEFSNADELFVLHLDSKTGVRFSAVHHGGFPNLNGTGRAQQYLVQGWLFETDKPSDKVVFTVGVELDPAWERRPVVTVNYYFDKQRVWWFAAEDAAMDEVLKQYRQAR